MTELKETPNQPPDRTTKYPFGVAFPGTGSYTNGPVSKVLNDALYGIQVYIVVAWRILPKDVEAVTGLLDTFVDKLQSDPQLNGTVQLITGLDYTFGEVDWAGQKLIGYIINITATADNC